VKLLTDQLRARLPPLYSQEAAADPVVYAKFFLPGTAWTWYVTEGSPEDEDYKFFGYVMGSNMNSATSCFPSWKESEQRSA
jgi:hypothetical protein